MSTFLETLYEDLLADEAARPRSQQIEIGGSGLYGCRAEHVLRLNGVAQSDPRLSWEAFVGSAIDERIGQARLRRRPHLLVQERVAYRGVTFSIDEFDKDDRTLTDWKSKDSATACSEAVLMMVEGRPGHEQKRAQLHGGAAALRVAGHDVEKIRLVFLPRAGSFDGAAVFEEPFSQEWADKGADWAQAVVEVSDSFGYNGPDDLQGLRDKPPFFCNAYCPFVSTCRGETPDTVEPDPMQLDAAQRYVAAKFEAEEANARKEHYRDLLQGAPPIITGGWKVAWSGGNPKTVVETDMAAVVEAYEFVIGPVPQVERTTFSNRSLRADQVKPKKAAKKANQ